MEHYKLALIQEQTSPQHRISWVYDLDEPAKTTFENNTAALHIGNGFFLSIANHLRASLGYYKSIDEGLFQKEILPILDGAQKNFLEQVYVSDSVRGKKYLNTTDPIHLDHIAKILKQKRFDTRWITLAEKQIIRPFLFLHFKENSFYKNPFLTRMFDPSKIFHHKETDSYSFLLEVELVCAFNNEDIALFKIVNTPDDVVAAIPSVEINYNLIDDMPVKLYCLQANPENPSEKLLNMVSIEGIQNYASIAKDDSNFQLQGFRYLVSGCFKNKSIGSPLLTYDRMNDKFKANALISESCQGEEFSTQSRTYINTTTLATPFFLIHNELKNAIHTYGNRL